MVRMRRSVCRKDQDIVKIGYRKDVENVMERCMNVILEGCGRIRKAEGHDCVFVVPVTGAEGCLPLISLLNTDPVVRVLDIEFAKDL